MTSRARCTANACWVISTLVLLAGLGIGTNARAAGRVDWSEYLEPPGSARPLKAPAAQPPAKTAATTGRKAPRVAKKPGAESKSKPKPPARTRHRAVK